MGGTDTTSIQSHHSFVRRQDIMTSELDRDLVMLSIENGKYYGMDPVGRHIWNLLREPICVADLCNLLCNDFEVDKAQCETEVIEFLQNLSVQNLISRCEIESL